VQSLDRRPRMAEARRMLVETDQTLAEIGRRRGHETLLLVHLPRSERNDCDELATRHAYLAIQLRAGSAQPASDRFRFSSRPELTSASATRESCAGPEPAGSNVAGFSEIAGAREESLVDMARLVAARRGGVSRSKV
jgi:hypothetical protein